MFTVRRTGATLLAASALAGCGSQASSSSQSNDSKIKSAQTAQENADALHAKLDKALRLHHYAGVDDVYKMSNGGLCDIEGVFMGDQAQLYTQDEATLMSPDGNAAVKVGTFEGTPQSDCMQVAKDALGW